MLGLSSIWAIFFFWGTSLCHCGGYQSSIPYCENWGSQTPPPASWKVGPRCPSNVWIPDCKLGIGIQRKKDRLTRKGQCNVHVCHGVVLCPCLSWQSWWACMLPSHHSAEGMVHCLAGWRVAEAMALRRHFLSCDPRRVLSCLVPLSLCSCSEPGYPGIPQICDSLHFPSNEPFARKSIIFSFSCFLCTVLLSLKTPIIGIEDNID